MIPHIPEQRKFKVSAAKPFDDLVAYIEATPDQSVELLCQLVNDFANVIDYATTSTDDNSGAEKCIAIRTHGVTGMATARLEMNTVAQKNTRCLDPVYHIILSWPEHEQPTAELIFDAAEHALDALGLGAHQYVLAVHGNTDNRHCHIAVNRIHPRTFKSHNIAWAHKTLHRAARESEIKHGWSHDNGLFVVEVDDHGQKHVVPSRERFDALAAASRRVHHELGREDILAPWHDPDSLESWLKTTVAKALKPALAELTGWYALHAWLSRYDITLKDSGGGGMRLHAVCAETGEILDLAASKGLRVLKRDALEKRWGPYANLQEIACRVPDFSHLTPKQIAKGVSAVLAMAERPPAHILLARQAVSPSQGRGHALLRDTAPRFEREHDMHKSSQRDGAQRAERKAQRSDARLDLQQRFAQHRNAVRGGDTEHFTRLKALQLARSVALRHIRAQSKAAKLAIPKATDLYICFITRGEIDAESLRRKLLVDADFQEKSHSLRAVRTPPLSWRAWLLVQSGLGDQAALSALRGIVYQAQRDAKRDTASDTQAIEATADSQEQRAQQYQRVMARLLEEEKKEAAIRSANSRAMRPFEADPLLVRYSAMAWHVTGNGNVQYRDPAGMHLFTDRGNRVTFDRKRVTDDEIGLALAHAQHKFGQPLTLTSSDPVFMRRMARLADEMGISILNPELQQVVAHHLLARQALQVVLVPAAPAPFVVQKAPPALLAPSPAVLQVPPTLADSAAGLNAQVVRPALTRPPRRRQRGDESGSVHQSGPPMSEGVPLSKPAVQSPAVVVGAAAEEADLLTLASSSSIAKTAQQAALLPTPATPEQLETRHERLRDMVLAIDANAQFLTPSAHDSEKTYFGKIVATLGEAVPGFAQLSTRLGAYILHATVHAPPHEAGDAIEVHYKRGQVAAKNTVVQGKGGHGD
ncbi:TraI/MobA(P) family conjugative relaxase [Polaromonas sp. CG_9.11]|uniref:TraI/MobA(P) family conjugative relaxase n=1 Tax=Polaromonas sp. CG_9.11 TaxID=2787730 RepID=UPI0018C9A8E6|nr:TraI/MobA(P) family conjugative relaxase [Polaromonas sp. CG_9.11]MBG6078230.1 hypothetical protein [Polaromonas sp. CG_9.11]